MQTSSNQQLEAETPSEISKKWLIPDLCFLILLLLLAVVWTVRSADADTFWGDEVFSVRLAQLPVDELVQRTSLDAHPPLYYLILKATFSLSESLGHAPDVLVGRTSGLIVILFGSVIVWWFLQPLAGRIGSALIAGLFALQPGLMDSATEMRNYALEIGFLGGLFLVMCRLLTAKSEERLTGLWLAYFLLGSAALWAHLLAAIPLVCLGLGWIAGALCKRENRLEFILGGIVSQALIILSFIPWLWKISHQTDYLDQVNLSWMTDPTAGNLVRTVAVAFVYGRRPWDEIAYQPWALITGLVCFLVPAVLLLIGIVQAKWSLSKPICLNILLGAFGIAVWLVHVLVLWLLARFEVVEVFHAPRYPALTSGIGCIGLGLLALGARKQGWFSPWLATVAVLPLVLGFLAGQAMAWQQRPYFNSLWNEFLAAADPEKFPTTDQPLYFYPDEMLPFFPQLAENYKVLPYSAWRNARGAGERDLNLAFFPVWNFHKHESLFLSAALIQGVPLGNDQTTSSTLQITSTGLSTPWMYVVHTPALSLQEQQQLKFLEPRVPLMKKQLGIRQIFPQELLLGDGWWRLMLDEGLAPYRLGINRTMVLHLNPPLKPGNYVMTLKAEKVGFTEGKPYEVELEYNGFLATETLSTREIDLQMSFSISKPMNQFSITAPLNSPTETPESPLEPGSIPKDQKYATNRRFSLKFHGITFEEQ